MQSESLLPDPTVEDDQSLVRGALAALLNMKPDISVVAECGSGDETVDKIQKISVDVALLDIEMLGLNGIDAAEALTKIYPNCRSIIVTTFGRAGYVRKALAAGAKRVPCQRHSCRKIG